MGTVCPICGFDNAVGLRFCTRCAAELADVCPICGFANPAGFKFCGQCGASLAAARLKLASDDELRRLESYLPSHLVEKMARQSREHKGERRTATILFCDLSGFTCLSERLDPEEVYSIMDELFKSFVEEVYRVEGTVDKFTGDGLMALFGAPVAHENDPERAVRAALGMQAVLERLNQNVVRRYGTRLHARFGLNAGEVILGSLGSDLRMDYTVIGDAVNVAARLEEAASPGTILVSAAIYQATETVFDYVPVGDIALKGRDKPVLTYQLLNEKARKGRPRGIHGLAAPLIGRDRELEQLQMATQHVLDSGRGHIILVSGEAGIGKSRVTTEWKEWLDGRSVHVLQCSAQSHTLSMSLWAFRDLLRDHFQVQEAETLEKARQKVAQCLQQRLGSAADALAPYIEHLLWLDIVTPSRSERMQHLTPAELRQQTFLAVRELIRAEASWHPLAIICEDIHWLDRSSLDLLLLLLGLVESLPIIFCCISRANEGVALEELASLARAQFAGQFSEIALRPLGENDICRLLDALLTSPDLSPALRASIPERAQGNPLFLEEILRAMIERGLITREADGCWRLAGSDIALREVPRTLRGIILTRVDALPEVHREVLQCASVLGRTFQRELLAGLVPATVSLDSSLLALQEHGLIQPESGGNGALFTFHHVLMQEAVYGTLLTRRRQALHRAAGHAIEDIYASRIEEHIDLLAHHYYLGDIPDRALAYSLQAGLRAANRYANDAATLYYQRALALSERAAATAEQQVDIHLGLGDLHSLKGEYEDALAQYEKALSAATVPVVGLPARRVADIERRAARAWERRGGYAEAEALLKHALALLADTSDSEDQIEEARAFSDLGWVAFRRGEIESAEAWTQRALTTFETGNRLQELSAAYNRLAGICHQRGDWERAVYYAQRGLEIRERIGHTAGMAMSYNNLSVIYMGSGNWTEGIRYAERSLEIKLRIGDVGGAGISFSNLGMAYKDRGDLDRARDYLLKSLATAKRIKNVNYLGSALGNLGQVSLLSGSWADAIGYYEESLKVARRSNSREQIAEALWLLGEAWATTDKLERAEGYVEQALRLAEEIGSKLARASAQRALAAIRARQGRLEEAIQMLRSCVEQFNELRNEIDAGRTYAQLALALADAADLTEAGIAMRKASDIFDHLGAARDGAEARRHLNHWEQMSAHPDRSA